MARFDQYEEPPRALEGLKVVELPCLDTMPFLAASMAAKSFADFGAEVVKVEPPRTGSQERALGPFRDEMPDPETGGLHLYLNTNKFGVTIDLKNPHGRDQVFDLLASADIVFNPNRPEVNEKLGIDWRTLTSRFPKSDRRLDNFLRRRVSVQKSARRRPGRHSHERGRLRNAVASGD